MDDLEFYKLGRDPEVEAFRMKRLYASDGVDIHVRDEFESTVQAYTSLSLTEITQRLRTRYDVDNPSAHGVLPVYKNTDIGMAIWGEKDYTNAETMQEIPGINVSAWLLRQYRGKGLGRRVIEFATAEALVLGKELGKQVWTSIRSENLASRRSCEHAGFLELGIQSDKPERLLYVVPSE